MRSDLPDYSSIEYICMPNRVKFEDIIDSIDLEPEQKCFVGATTTVSKYSNNSIDKTTNKDEKNVPFKKREDFKTTLNECIYKHMKGLGYKIDFSDNNILIFTTASSEEVDRKFDELYVDYILNILPKYDFKYNVSMAYTHVKSL